VARKPFTTSLKQMSEINMTSMMDLTFMLLITFILTFPLLEQGIPVNLPQGKGNELEPDKSLTITIDGAGTVHLSDAPITLPRLRERMVALAGRDPNTTVMVRADKDIRYGVVVGVLRVLHEAKITRMALVTQADEKPRR
jgi:biopolymer transport protein TolR